MLRSLDLLPVVRNDIMENTCTGGVFSLLAIFSLGYFVMSEILIFKKTEIVSTLQVEEPGVTSHLLDRLTLQFNITFPNCACHVLSIETHDTLGGLYTDYEKKVYAKSNVELIQEKNVQGVKAVEVEEKRKGNFINK